MSTVLVVTLGDVVGLGALAALLLIVGVVVAMDKYDAWKRRRIVKRQQTDGGTKQ